ncbi:MAG: TraB/GumN family protein [Planctomycetes bacterium]|nr:TraB/GumN family protein [Planctomycetota bacterium]
MKHVLTCALALTLTVLPSLAQAQDSKPATKKKTARKLLLWKVSGKGLKTPSYLFGTIHLPDKRVLALPKAVDKAIDASDALFCELALEKDLQVKMTPHLMLGGGKTLVDVLGQDLVDRAAKLLAAKGLPIQPFLQLKPWVLMSQLTMLLEYFQESMTQQPALDSVLYNRAKAAGKEVGGLEKVEDQLAVFDSLSAKAQKKMVAEGLDGFEKAAKEGTRTTEPLVRAYLSGDLGEMMKQSKEEIGDDKEMIAFMKLLLDDRNVTMTAAIAKHLKGAPSKTFFFAVGSAHYPGKLGIVALLKAKGFTVERVAR